MLFLFLKIFINLSQAQVSCGDVFQYESQHKATVKVGYVERDIQIFKPSYFSKNKKYPVVIYFHGTGFSVNLQHPVEAKYGLYYESQFIKKLNESGYVVIAPTANQILPLIFPGGVLAWEGNIFPYSSNFSGSRDYALVKEIFSNMESLIGAPINSRKIFLAGFSSGGYMSSRIANEAEFAESIAGIIVHSASYGTCLQGSCSIPSQLPENHPKTLLVANRDDSVVPFETVEKYKDRLQENGIKVESYYHKTGDHAWLPSHANYLVKWLNSVSVE